MSFREDIKNYTNTTNGLVGMLPNKVNYSSGNVVLETGTAYVFLRHLDVIKKEDSDSIINAFLPCVKFSNFYSNKPYSLDRISHDDVIGLVSGLACGSSYCHTILEKTVIDYGKMHWWILSTDGHFYWDALTKPWHRAFYMIAYKADPSFLDVSSLYAMIVIDGIFNKNNSSDKRLFWLMIQNLKGFSSVGDLCIRSWYMFTKIRWGSVKNIFKAYHGEDHIFTRYCWE